jgi:hypothetical protein
VLFYSCASWVNQNSKDLPEKIQKQDEMTMGQLFQPNMGSRRELKKEYDTTGLLLATFPLRSFDLHADLMQDAAEFNEMVTAYRQSGLHRVPYRVTPAIEKISKDPNILKIVHAILGPSEPWVMWGSNIQRGTPNQAGYWHVDIESWHWPSITIVIGLTGCEEGNATRCIPYSHHLPLPPSILPKNATAEDVLARANRFDPRCEEIIAPVGFETGRFYVFNARCWHSGNLASSKGRLVLFLHYQRAADPRIPYMKDYLKGSWFDEPAAYIWGPGLTNGPEVSKAEVNQNLYPRPRRKIRPYYAMLRILDKFRFADRGL